ncbi:hypothetical protein H072_1626 [Dactylellina haptotyla CBS 200.50]|uniref:Peptidase S8/S53 domain-containing protein n=1 Tax=Dactylellina haptotyla (strain CBS 200.50) TaxID=1284197 RepID=S8C9S9_DACHA|nr:hypothetical protein H072_1626 [Dactylellina haptotyla CBS 200.50]
MIEILFFAFYFLVVFSPSSSAWSSSFAPFRNTTVTQDPNGDKTVGDFIVLLKPEEERPWDILFGELGLNSHPNIKLQNPSKDRYGTRYGDDVLTFGQNLRMARIKNLRRSDRDKIKSLASVDSIQPPIKPMIPKFDIEFPRASSSKTQKRNLDKRENSPTAEFYTHNGKPWNLERLSTLWNLAEPPRPADQLAFTYLHFDKYPGTGVDVYILDSGLRMKHSVQFGNRIGRLFDEGIDADDYTGHGTICASIIGSKSVGVAFGANIFGVKVGADEKIAGSLNKSTTSSRADHISVEFAIDGVISRHKQRLEDPSFKGSVISISWFVTNPVDKDDLHVLARPEKGILFKLLERAIDEGIHITAPAGDYGTDACLFRLLLG